MAAKRNHQLFERVRTHAFRTLSVEQRQTTNLHLDERIFKKGETIGPPRQNILAPRDPVFSCSLTTIHTRTFPMHAAIFSMMPAAAPCIGRCQRNSLRSSKR